MTYEITIKPLWEPATGTSQLRGSSGIIRGRFTLYSLITDQHELVFGVGS